MGHILARIMSMEHACGSMARGARSVSHEGVYVLREEVRFVMCKIATIATIADA